jgi:hypothetical protein
MLPSGRHVAISLSPLSGFIESINEPCNLDRILAIETFDGLYPYTEVMFLQSPDRHEEPVRPLELDVHSLAPPEGMVLVTSGLRLSDWNSLTSAWSDEDKVVFREFLSGRATELFQTAMDAVARVRKVNAEEKRRRAEKLLGVLRTLPEEEWIKQLETKDWDDYDMLAALGFIVRTVSDNPDMYSRHCDTFDRICGMWLVLQDELMFLQEPASPEESVRALARKWRAINDRDYSPIVKSWHDQLVIACMYLWDHAGKTLEDLCPGAFGILTMVTLSPGGADHRARTGSLSS